MYVCEANNLHFYLFLRYVLVLFNCAIIYILTHSLYQNVWNSIAIPSRDDGRSHHTITKLMAHMGPLNQ